MKRSVTFHNGTLALLAFAAFSTGPAAAQRGVEFGYKDRIFQENYLLPDPLEGPQAFAADMVALMRLGPKPDGQPGLPSSRVIEAMGGACRSALYPEPSSSDFTPDQRELEAMPRVAKPTDGNARADTGFPDDKICYWQMALFDAAYADPLSTDAQLARLAKDMRGRFSQVWLSVADVAAPQVREGARRVKLLVVRIGRLQRVGAPEPPCAAELNTLLGQSSFVDAMRRLSEAEPYGSCDLQLTALEQATVQARRDAKAREQAEAVRLEQERQPQRARPQVVAERQQPSQGVEQQPQVLAALPPDTGHEPLPREPSQDPAQEQRSREETERQRQEAARRAEISRLEGRLAELDRAISHLQGQLASQQAAVLRNPLTPQNAISGIAGISKAQTELDQAQAERSEVERRLGRLRKAALAGTATASRAPGPPTARADCQQGQSCRVIETTLFCRTPQQMAAILSQRPGPARKQVLNVLAASGDCRQIAQGETLQWTAPIAMVQPQGEPMAELVPGTLADGTAGFLLKDGVIARTGIAAR